jgi:hypothetical protein
MIKIYLNHYEIITELLRDEVLTAEKKSMLVFWVVRTCKLERLS